MPNINTHSSGVATLDNNGANSALYWAIGRLLEPVARLCLAHGITFAVVEELFKRAFVQEVVSLQPEAPEHGIVSRISTATGINRREVTRLIREETSARVGKQPLAAELIAHWTTDASYREPTGEPRVLSRLGAVPSFEDLAQKMTRDVHPRSILDELIRLGLVRHDQDSDCITLVRTDFVPLGDVAQMLGLLGDNVGDHLSAAVANVTGSGKHLEQAVFADELSAESAAALHPLITTHWQALRDKLVPAITGLIEADQHAGRKQDQRVRIGLYSFSETAAAQEPPRQERAARRLRTAAPKETQL
jgi:hypothetical protein